MSPVFQSKYWPLMLVARSMRVGGSVIASVFGRQRQRPATAPRPRARRAAPPAPPAPATRAEPLRLPRRARRAGVDRHHVVPALGLLAGAGIDVDRAQLDEAGR